MSTSSKSQSSFTFKVNDVPVDEKLYPVVQPSETFGRFAEQRTEAWSVEGELIHSEHGHISKHAVIAAIHCAFADHKPLVLTPDHIWLLLCQGFAEHVKLNHEELRFHFTTSATKIPLTVHRNDFIKGSPDNDWAGVFPEFSAKIREHSGSIVDVLTACFSTTSVTAQVAFQITLMDAVQYYFEYGVMSLCGIPFITLVGTPADWQDLIRRFERFREYGMEGWVTALLPVLREFTQPGVNLEFWQSIYKYKSQSGGAQVTGWIVQFFPYINDQRNPVAWGEVPLSEHAGLSSASLPVDVSRAPFRWSFPSVAYNMEFIAGFMGVTQDKDTYAVSPAIGWLICEGAPIHYLTNDDMELIRRSGPLDLSSDLAERLERALIHGVTKPELSCLLGDILMRNVRKGIKN